MFLSGCIFLSQLAVLCKHTKDLCLETEHAPIETRVVQVWQPYVFKI